MRVSCHNLDRLDVTFDDEHLVANAGLLLPAALAQHLGLRELFDEHVDLGLVTRTVIDVCEIGDYPGVGVDWFD